MLDRRISSSLKAFYISATGLAKSLMIRDFHIAKREEDISTYAGYVGLFSILSLVLVSTFGWQSLHDFLNGLIGPIKAYAAEIFRQEYQALGMSTISTAWDIGLIIGPALGGFLSQISLLLALLMHITGFLGRGYCFILATVLVELLNHIVFILKANVLQETLHNHDSRMPPQSSYEALEAASDTKDGNESAPKENLFMNQLLSIYVIGSSHGNSLLQKFRMFSLWAVSPRKFGGLSYSTVNVGEVPSISGFISSSIDKLPLYRYAVWDHPLRDNKFCIRDKECFIYNFSWAQKRLDASILPGDQVIFFVLNVMEAIAVLLAFKPFLVEKQNT
ncbi:hypothetical protein RND71_026589 [Anisodus tanguticus]|uniref:Uncharacterized protein n=1 Tax=Anisodus tanguticus TaxID=243964 RepID=A0AAE1RL82_9SOLA|nr:hypothetical protein RND71_026589 [Anisodus tanguticus]